MSEFEHGVRWLIVVVPIVLVYVAWFKFLFKTNFIFIDRKIREDAIANGRVGKAARVSCNVDYHFLSDGDSSVKYRYTLPSGKTGNVIVAYTTPSSGDSCKFVGMKGNMYTQSIY